MSLIKVDDISFKYNKYILKDISFDVEKASFISLLGINGAGKSTLLKQLVKLLKPESGIIYIGGRDIRHISHNNMAKQIAYVSQYNFPVKNTVYDTILIGRLPYISSNAAKEDYAKVEEIIEKLELYDYALRDASTLSGGEFQKVILARALAQEPKILLLDEPTSSLDIKNQVTVMRLVKEYCTEKHISVIVSIHDINLAIGYSDKFIMLKDGRIHSYGDESILTAEAIKEVYKLDVEVIYHNKRTVILMN